MFSRFALKYPGVFWSVIDFESCRNEFPFAAVGKVHGADNNAEGVEAVRSLFVEVQTTGSDMELRVRI